MSSTSAASLLGPPAEEVAARLSLESRSSVPEYLCDIAAQYGPLAAIDFGGRRYVLISDPAAIRDVLVTKASSFRKGRDAVYELVRDGLFTSAGVHHTLQRRAAHPLFHAAQGGSLEEIALAQTRAFVDARRGAEMIDAGREMRRLALSIGAAALFAVQLDDPDDAIGEALRVVMARAGRGIFGGLRYAESAAELRSFRRAKESLQDVASTVIARSRRSFVSNLGASGAPPAPDQLRDRVLTLLLAAQESTAIALTWALWLLARNRPIQDRLRDHTNHTIGNRALGPQDLSRLTYAAAVFKETLRLYPPAWIIGRRARKRVDLGGTTLPRGSTLFLSPYVVQRNERYYRNATRFEPERWMVDRAHRPAYAYFPFGGGERSCIGERFASVEGTLVLTELIRKLDISLVDNVSLQAEPLLTLRPHQLFLRVRATGGASTLATWPGADDRHAV